MILEAIKGIGPNRAQELKLMGIETFEQFAYADPAMLVDAMEVSPAMIKGWIDDALELDILERETAVSPLPDVGTRTHEPVMHLLTGDKYG